MNVASRRTSTTIINRRVSRLGPVAAAAAPSAAREVARGGGQGPWTPGQSIEQMDKFGSIPFPARMLHTKCRGRH